MSIWQVGIGVCGLNGRRSISGAHRSDWDDVRGLWLLALVSDIPDMGIYSKSCTGLVVIAAGCRDIPNAQIERCGLFRVQ